MNTKIIFFLFFSPTFLLSQVIDWPVGTIWKYYQTQFGPPTDPYYTVFKVEKDTIIQNKNVKKIANFFWFGLISNHQQYTRYHYLLKEGSKVLNYEPSTQLFNLLYDFNLNQNDTFLVSGGFLGGWTTYLIDSITQTKTNTNLILNVQNVSFHKGERRNVFLSKEIIQDIGNTFYLFPGITIADPPLGGSLVCFTNGTVIYPHTAKDCNLLVSSIDVSISSTSINTDLFDFRKIVIHNPDPEFAIHVFDLNGKLIQKFSASDIRSNSYSFDLRTDIPGIIFINYSSAKQNFTKKEII